MYTNYSGIENGTTSCTLGMVALKFAPPIICNVWWRENRHPLLYTKYIGAEIGALLVHEVQRHSLYVMYGRVEISATCYM